MKLETLIDLGVGSLKQNDIEQLYLEKTSHVHPERLVSLDSLIKVSQEISEEQPLYIHS
jgi:hypothetical protein